MFLPMTTKDLRRFVRACFWDSLKDFISLAYPDDSTRVHSMDVLMNSTKNEELKKKFLAETKEDGLKIVWFVRCYDCEEDNDVEVIMANDDPGKPIACPKCGEKNIDIILKGVMEA